MGAFFTALIFVLVMVTAGGTLVVWGQAYGALPPRKNGRRYPVDWEIPFEMLLVVFITSPVAVMVYVTLVAASDVQLLVDAAMFLVAALVALIALDNFNTCCRYLASERWPTTRGRLFKSRRFYYLLYHEYSYEVSGRRHFGNKIDAHNYLKSPRYVAYDPYQNAEVTVHYHPSNPEISLLEPGVNWSSVSVTLSISIIMMAVPIFFWMV
ncbi:MAG: DUF3592 domain-containing protein [Anaerolineae bacterium]|jgi:hypothetical protein|nr:DUF3592 domain-containing protein [Anaerolineae bacterium]